MNSARASTILYLRNIYLRKIRKCPQLCASECHHWTQKKKSNSQYRAPPDPPGQRFLEQPLLSSATILLFFSNREEDWEKIIF